MSIYNKDKDCGCDDHYDDGEQGTNNCCNNCCVGPEGPQGPIGPQGIQGVKGDTGPIGPQGAQGIPGPKGDTGLQGPKGNVGATGPQGAQGIPGPKGDTGLQGAKGDIGATGPKGDTGAQGPKGDKGETGMQGLQGLTGPKGDAGSIGPQGMVGPQGPQGATGPKGDAGAPGPQGPTGATGPQGPAGPKGDSASCCCTPGPTGAQGPIGPQGAQGVQGEEGKAGASMCPCEITMGKAISFLIENGFPFDASVNGAFDFILSSTDETPAVLFNTWGVEFENQAVVPLCKLEALYFSFSTEQERDTFVNLISVVLNQTLSCCHSCGTCDICPDILEVNKFNSIKDMPANCAYEYYLSSTCNCENSECDTIAKRVDLCNFSNSTGEKLRGIIEKKQDEENNILRIATQKESLIDSTIVKVIEGTGLSSVLVSYEETGDFNLALVCLETVTIVSFEAQP